MAYLILLALLISPFVFIVWIIKHNRKVRRLNREEIKDPSKKRERKVRVAVKVPNGENRVGVYTYDGKPLENRPPMSELILVVLPWKESMQSVYTGTSWSGYGCVSYDGKPVGFVSTYSSYYDVLMAMTQKFGPISVHARVDGYDSTYGYPRIELKLPDGSYFSRLLK